MPTTVLATALPYSLADGAPFHLTAFLTHKLVGGRTLADFPAAADWVGTLADCSFALSTSLDPSRTLPLRVVSKADATSWSAVLPPDTPVEEFPTPAVSDATWRTNPASRMSDHAIGLHLDVIAAAPAWRPRPGADPATSGLLETLADLDRNGPLRRLLDAAPDRARRALLLAARRLGDALTTIGPLDEIDETDPEREDGGEIPPPPQYRTQVEEQTSAVQVLLDDPEADLRVTRRLDALVGEDLSADPDLQLIVDAHAMRRYYERPEQPQQAPRTEPDLDAAPPPRPARPEHDFHAKAGSFGSTPALLRRLGLAVDLVLDGVDAAGARAALAGATWVTITMTSSSSTTSDLRVLPPRRTAVTVNGPVFTARSSDAWVGGALPLGEDDWVVLDADPDASGLKLDQFTRTLARQYAGAVNGDSAASAPGTLRATGFALARRNRAAQLRERVREAEQLAADDGTRELLLDDLVRGIRVEVWDDRTKAWHSLHRRRVSVTAEPGGVLVLDDAQDVGFLQLSALNRAPGDDTNGYYVHEVVAGWDGWSLSAPRPGLTIVHVEPSATDDATEIVVDTPPDPPINGAHITSRVEPGSLPRLRYGMSYSFRVLAVDLAGNSVPRARREPPEVVADEAAVHAARAHLELLQATYERRDRPRVDATRRDASVERLRAVEEAAASPSLPDELRSGDARIDEVFEQLLAQAAAGEPAQPAAQRRLEDVVAASRVLAARDTLRVRPQLGIDPQRFAELARNDDLLLPEEVRRPTRPIVTAPRPYLRWEPVAAPALVARHELGTGEQLAHLVVRSGIPDAPARDTRHSAERHLAPPKATQLEAETAGRFDSAIGTGDEAEIRRLYAVALAERGTLLDQFVPSLLDARATEEQPDIALLDRPGADTGSPHRATLADIGTHRGRPIGEGQYVVHDTDALRLPYLPDPYAAGVSLVFYEAGSPHELPEPRALQSVSVPYPGEWPAVQPLRLILERGDVLDARVVGHEVHVAVPPGEQVRVALSSTVDVAALEHFGLWRSHLASVADPADGYTTEELVAAATLMRAASSGWTWWLTPSVDVRLVHAVPAPVRPPRLATLSLFLRPPGRAVAALSGLVDVHGPSTDLLIVRASWTEQVDDVTAPGPQEVAKSDVVVRSPVAERQRTGILFLFDYLATATPGAASSPLSHSLGGRGIGFHRMLQTFEDTRYRRVTYVPSGTSRYAELFERSQLPDEPVEGEPIVLDIPSSARPAAPVVLDAVPLLRWEALSEPDEPFAWRQVRRSGVRVWLARPWFSSGDGELLGVLVFDTVEWVRQADGSLRQRPKAQQAPDGATSLWAADPIAQRGGTTSNPTVPPLLTPDQLVLDELETGMAVALGTPPPPAGGVVGGRNRGWLNARGTPVAVAASVPLRDVPGHPTVRVLGYRPEYDEASGRWFVDVALNESPALWPFVRLAVARYQPHSIQGSALSPVALTGWVQPLPARTLTVSRPDARQVQVTLTGAVNWLRWSESPPELAADQLSADAPTGAAAVRASRLQQSRTVRATVQSRPDGAGDLEWSTVADALLLAVNVQESGAFQATWTGSLTLPGHAEPGLRRPGGVDSSWRVLVEEHELLDADPSGRQEDAAAIARLVYADAVSL